MRKPKAGDEVVLNEGGQEGYIVFACGKESFMVHLLSGADVMVHRSALRLKQETPAPAPRVIVLEDE